MLSALALTLAASTSMVAAQPVRWTTYTIPQTGTSVDLPASVFTERVGPPAKGYGERFQTADGRAKLTIQAAANTSNDSPASFLARRHPPPHIQYKRVAPRFFAVSSYRGDQVWYDRCNFARALVQCVLISYPASEQRNWDDIVTRISLSLSGK
jgi:hypothetical protein